MRRLLLCLALAAAGCVSGRKGLTETEILTQAPVIREAPEVRPEAGIGEAEARAALESAREAFLREDYEECLSVARETLAKLPPMEVARELRALRFRARKLLFERRVLEGRVLPERDVCPLDSEVVLDLGLVNVSPGEVRIPRTAAGASGAVFVVDLVREDWDVFGNVRATRSRRVVPLAEALVLPAGGRGSTRLTLPAGSSRDRHRGFSVLRVKGVFRPAVILAGEERYYSGVDLAEAVVRIVPPGYEPIAADPFGTLEKAWRLGAPEHLLLAAELSPPERKSEVVRRLVGFLESGEAGPARAVLAALARLTGRSFGGDVRAWVAWWREEGERGGDGT